MKSTLLWHLRLWHVKGFVCVCVNGTKHYILQSTLSSDETTIIADCITAWTDLRLTDSAAQQATNPAVRMRDKSIWPTRPSRIQRLYYRPSVSLYRYSLASAAAYDVSSDADDAEGSSCMLIRPGGWVGSGTFRIVLFRSEMGLSEYTEVCQQRMKQAFLQCLVICYWIRTGLITKFSYTDKFNHSDQTMQ